MKTINRLKTQRFVYTKEGFIQANQVFFQLKNERIRESIFEFSKCNSKVIKGINPEQTNIIFSF